MIVGKEASSPDALSSEPRTPPAFADGGIPQAAVEPVEEAAPVAAYDLASSADLGPEPPQIIAGNSVSHAVDEIPDVAEAAVTTDAPASDLLQADNADHLAEASPIAARPFDETRNLMWTSAAAAGQDGVFEPFKLGPDMFKGFAAPDFTRAAEVMAELNARAMGQFRSSAEAALAHWQSLVGVRSVSEAIVLNAGFARKQIESMNAHARDLTELAAQLGRETTKPRG